MFWTELIVGIFIGCFLGVITLSVIIMLKGRDEG